MNITNDKDIVERRIHLKVSRNKIREASSEGENVPVDDVMNSYSVTRLIFSYKICNPERNKLFEMHEKHLEELRRISIYEK